MLQHRLLYQPVLPTGSGPSLALSYRTVGYRGARSSDQPFWSTVQLCCQERQFDSCLFPVVLAIQKRAPRWKTERGCKTPLPGASGEVQPSLVLPGVGKRCDGVERSEQGSWVSRTEPDNRDNSGPCACSGNNEGVYINRAPRNCAKMITLPLRLLGIRRLLGFVMAWRSSSDLFVLTAIIVWACMVLGGRILTIAKQAKLF